MSGRHVNCHVEHQHIEQKRWQVHYVCRKLSSNVVEWNDCSVSGNHSLIDSSILFHQLVSNLSLSGYHSFIICSLLLHHPVATLNHMMTTLLSIQYSVVIRSLLIPYLVTTPLSGHYSTIWSSLLQYLVTTSLFGHHFII